MDLLLIAPYPLLARPLRVGLEEEGFTVDVARDDTEAERRLAAKVYDAIVVDLLRDNSLDTLRAWRQRGVTAPILMLAVPGSLAHQAAAADLRPGDTLTKPFELAELLARLRRLTAAPGG
jgi:two-component system OmpR family response regulator